MWVCLRAGVATTAAGCSNSLKSQSYQRPAGPCGHPANVLGAGLWVTIHVHMQDCTKCG